MASPPSQPNGVLRDQALRFMLERRGAAIVPVTGGETSMVPHLYGGDAVLVVPLGRPPAPGDLLLYRQQDYWVVHRCLGAATGPDGAPGFRTRGDGRNVLDPHLLSDNNLARVVALRRAGQWSSLQGSSARGYARCMAWHGLCWAAAGVLARKARLGNAVAAMDLATLRTVVPLVFPLIHRRIPPPTANWADGAL